jgi:hypothetical protein
MIIERNAHSRGLVQEGWLDSRHTFSFGGYYDPAWMGFGPLRVINEDIVEPGAGFPPHRHANMEILSYVLEGPPGAQGQQRWRRRDPRRRIAVDERRPRLWSTANTTAPKPSRCISCRSGSSPRG